MPTFILFNNNNITINDEKRDMKTRFPDMILNEHVAVVHTFSPRYFAGVTLVMSNSLYGDRDNLRINNNHWRMRTFLGIRL